MDADLVPPAHRGPPDALLAGEVERATEDFSDQLRTNLGTTVSQWPLPLTETVVESVEPSASGYVCVVRLMGERQLLSAFLLGRQRLGLIDDVAHLDYASACRRGPSSAALTARLHCLLARRGDVTERKMFGGIAWMVRDRVAVGVVGDD